MGLDVLWVTEQRLRKRARVQAKKSEKVDIRWDPVLKAELAGSSGAFLIAADLVKQYRLLAKTKGTLRKQRRQERAKWTSNKNSQ